MTERAAVAVTGATGLVGSALVASLVGAGHTVRRLVRRSAPPLAGVQDVPWNPSAGELDVRDLAGLGAVVHLAGESVAQRWTPKVKDDIRTSRVDSTRLLAERLARLEPPPRVLVSASAVGIYGNRGDEVLDESSSLGSDFLAGVGRDWEAATEPAARAGVRVVNTRFGIVLSAHGGALTKMLPPFRLGAGGTLGDGSQWTSWVALADVVSALRFAIDRESMAGPVNVTAPTPVTNAQFTQTLGEVLHRPTLARVPK
ncbi:MAG: TIGR01777 family oxidoreductase, partial [Gemmatimonadaceae bacterium]